MITRDSELEDFREKERKIACQARCSRKSSVEKKNHLWKEFKVGKNNRGFKVLRRELFSFGARISKVQRGGGGNRGFC